MTNSKISLPIKQINLLILIDLILICLSLWLLQVTDIDLILQNRLFDFDGQHWLIDRTEPVKKFIFYIFPKVLFGLTIAGCIMALVKDDGTTRSRVILILLALIFIPLTAGNIKKFTNVYCPANLEIYGGDKPYVKIFDSYPEDFHSSKKGQCFPAGHCLTGFSFMILFFALRKKSHRISGLIGATALGWMMGWYQMAKGVHFFGDTLISMLVAFLFAALITKFYVTRLQKISD